MAVSVLEFAQRCLNNIDYEFLTLFDLKRGQEGSLSTYPDDWCKRYISQRYFEYDYVHFQNLYLPVIWGEHTTKDMAPVQQKIFQEAQDFQIYHGITIPYFATGAREFITLTFPKREKLSGQKIQSLSMELRTIGQIILTYKQILENTLSEASTIQQFIQEIALWKDRNSHHQKKQQMIIDDILNDIKSCQMFIAHHETKDLGLEVLHRVYKDIENKL